MRRIKIFNIITSGLRTEGISLTQLDFFNKINMNKFEIIVASVRENGSDIYKEFEKNNCNVLFFPDREEHTFKYFIALINSLKEIKPDIVHVHGSSAIMSLDLLAAQIAGVKIRIAHSRNTNTNHISIDRALRPIFRRIYTVGLACGQDAGIWLFDNKPFTIVHNGKDFKKFHFDQQMRNCLRNSYGIQDKIVVGHVGNFNYQKNHDFLIRVFWEFYKRHNDAILYLMGTGKLMDNVKKLVQELGLCSNVIFAGNVNNVSECLQAMDIMVFPSRFEGLPNVVLEWQLEGLPCLISDKITHECASSNLVRFASIEGLPSQWADSMDEMLKVYTDRKKQANNACIALKNDLFDINDSVQQLENIYENLVL